jgi:hypothetical protein
MEIRTTWNTLEERTNHSQSLRDISSCILSVSRLDSSSCLGYLFCRYHSAHSGVYSKQVQYSERCVWLRGRMLQFLVHRLSVCQMARHTSCDRYNSGCCTENGLDASALDLSTFIYCLASVQISTEIYLRDGVGLMGQHSSDVVFVYYALLGIGLSSRACQTSSERTIFVVYHVNFLLRF